MARRKPTEAELELWQHVAKTTRPLAPRRRKKLAGDAEPEAVKAAEKKPAPPGKRAKTKIVPVATTEAVPHHALPKVHDLSHGVTVGIDKRQADRFRGGKLEIDGKIDLHGRTQAEAHDALHDFVHRAHRAGKRCLLVITGKGGTKTPDGERTRGILRQAVPRWLNEPGLRRFVLAFDHARPQHGGEGALYVLLKRER
jgi:DNA-nicking Smr family endonuclease